MTDLNENTEAEIREELAVDHYSLLMHWYSFTYMGASLDCGGTCNASTYTGYLDKKVTVPRIHENKANAGVVDGATLVAVCYLGYMTKAEFTTDA